MNWFTKSFVSHKGMEPKHRLVQEHGGCEHVVKDSSITHVVSYENDSFGKEGYCLCKECYEKMQREADEELCTCYYCNGSFPRREVIHWTWYDFYAPQGDEPIVVCDSCQTKDEHKERVARDDADRAREFEYDDDDE